MANDALLGPHIVGGENMDGVSPVGGFADMYYCHMLFLDGRGGTGTRPSFAVYKPAIGAGGSVPQREGSARE